MEIRKLYDIARSARVTNEYISYIEYVLHGSSFSARELAEKIYKAAMLKYEASVRKHADAIDANCDMADQLNSVRSFAIKYGLMSEYVIAIECVALNVEKFDMRRVLNKLTESAICIYDMRLRNRIDAATGITLIGGEYHDAV